MRLGCCLPLALLLLCATAASANYAGALTNLPVGMGNLLEQEQPQCLNVLSVCKAGCDEQLLKCSLHKPLAGVEAIDRFSQVFCCLLGLVVAALVADNIRIRRQLGQSAWQFHELEAHLRHCLQGVKDQAFNYAQKLEEQTPRQAASSQAERRQQRDVRSPTPDVDPKVWLCVPAPAAPARCQVHSLCHVTWERMLARLAVRPPDRHPCAGGWTEQSEVLNACDVLLLTLAGWWWFHKPASLQRRIHTPCACERKLGAQPGTVAGRSLARTGCRCREHGPAARRLEPQGCLPRQVPGHL